MGIFSDLLLEVTADEKYTKQYTNKLDRELFNKAVEIDPTSKGNDKVGKYVDWIIKNKSYDLSTAKINELKDYLKEFDKKKEKLPADKRDINKLKYDDFVEIMKTAIGSKELVSKTEKKTEDQTKAEKESEVVFDSEKYIIIHTKTKLANRYYGAGSDWCTARQDDYNNMFDHYNAKGDLYIIINKNSKKKWQLFKGDKDHKGEYEYRDEDDKSINPRAVFNKYYDVINWLDENDFPDQGEITDEKARELADNFVGGLSFTNDKLRNDAIDLLQSMIVGFNDTGYEDGGYNAIDYAKDRMREWEYELDESLSSLAGKYGIDIDSDKNKLNILPYIDSEISYEIKHDKSYNFEFNEDEWEYIWSNKTADEIADMLDNELDENNWNTIKGWLMHLYTDDIDSFKTAVDDLIAARKKDKHPLSDKEEDELKEIFAKVRHKGYKKLADDQEQPELKLDNVNHVKYIDRILSENK